MVIYIKVRLIKPRVKLQKNKYNWYKTQKPATTLCNNRNPRTSGIPSTPNN